MRTVEYQVWERLDNKNNWGNVSHKGKFHQWVTNFQSNNDGGGSYAEAIIEKEDGTVILVHWSQIKFINTP